MTYTTEHTRTHTYRVQPVIMNECLSYRRIYCHRLKPNVRCPCAHVAPVSPSNTHTHTQAVFHQAETAAVGHRDQGHRRGSGQQDLDQSARRQDPGEHTGILYRTECGRSETVSETFPPNANETLTGYRLCCICFVAPGFIARRAMTTSRTKRWSRSASAKTVSVPHSIWTIFYPQDPNIYRFKLKTIEPYMVDVWNTVRQSIRWWCNCVNLPNNCVAHLFSECISKYLHSCIVNHSQCWQLIGIHVCYHINILINMFTKNFISVILICCIFCVIWMTQTDPLSSHLPPTPQKKTQNSISNLSHTLRDYL